MHSFRVVPEDVGLARVSVEDIAVGGPAENAAAAESVLAGEPGPIRDMVVLNAAAGLVVAGLADDLAAGVESAGAAIDSGRAASVLAELVAVSRAALRADTDG